MSLTAQSPCRDQADGIVAAVHVAVADCWHHATAVVVSELEVEGSVCQLQLLKHPSKSTALVLAKVQFMIQATERDVLASS